jgi:peptidoglycan/LPS O-acetylase OafA/YrhL
MGSAMTARNEATPRDQRVHWLDGMRGAAAMFVVLHHMFLSAWPDFPSSTAPWWLRWLLYGHMAVAVFIVVSGFSLALAPMRNGGRLKGGIRRFLSRRAWRILPAYWAALVLSVIVTALWLQPDLSPGAIVRSLGVHGLLLQDVVGSASPNGALWSIAIEWQIYFVFPLILLLARRTSISFAVTITALVVLVAHALAGLGGLLDKINGLTPQFLALFALGALAVWLGSGERADRLRRPLAAVALTAVASFVVLAVTQGSEWMVARFFWMDLLFGVGVASGLAVIHAGGGRPLSRVLSSRPALWLGLFSYSVYLVHAPIVGVLDQHLVGPLEWSPLAAFGLILAIGVPVVVGLAYGFHQLFEAPFLRNRGWGAVKTMPIVRLVSRRRRLVPAPAPATADQTAA